MLIIREHLELTWSPLAVKNKNLYHTSQNRRKSNSHVVTTIHLQDLKPHSFSM